MAGQGKKSNLFGGWLSQCGDTAGAKEPVNRFDQRTRNFALPRCRQKLFFITAIGQKAQFNQHGWHIGRFQNAETGKAVGAVEQLGFAARIIDHQIGKFDRQVFGFSLCQINQNIGHFRRLVGKINAGNNVRLVFLFGQCRRFFVRCRFGQCIY